MKKYIVLSVLIATVAPAAPSFAFEEAMHLYLAHETLRNLRIKSAGIGAAPPYAGWVYSEWDTLAALLAGKASRNECDGTGAVLCRALITRLIRLAQLREDVDVLAPNSDSPAPAIAVARSTIVAPSRLDGSSVSSWLSTTRERVGRFRPDTEAKVDLLFPFNDTDRPFADQEGALVPAPFEDALRTLGEDEFQRHFYAGVLGPDSFPDIFTGGVVVHRDWSSARGWKSSQWAEYVLDRALNRALFQRIAGAEWSADRRFWKKFSTREKYIDHLQAQAIAFAYGYWVHFAQDAVAHELVNSFNGGAFDAARLLPKRNSIVEQRHSAVEGYLLEKIKPWAWKYSSRLSDLKIPVSFLREILLREEGLSKAPLAVHLRVFDSLDEVAKRSLKCEGEASLCDNKPAPLMFAAIACVNEGRKCYEETLCGMLKHAMPDRGAKIRDARDGWLLLSLAIARHHALKSAHPDALVDGSSERASETSIATLFVRAAQAYGFEMAENAVVYARQKDAKASFETQVAAALEMYSDRFLVPTFLPLEVRYFIGEDGRQHRGLFMNAKLQAFLEVDCKDTYYANVSGLCEVTTKLLKEGFNQLKALAESTLGELRAKVLIAAHAHPERNSPDCPGAFAGTADERMNRTYPGVSCPKELGWCATCDRQENLISHEIKRRLARFVGSDASSSGSADSAFLAMLGQNDGEVMTPERRSPWIRRSMSASLFAMISGISIDKLVHRTAEKRGQFPETSKCIRALKEKSSEDHPLGGVLASLVGSNERSGDRFQNRFYDELKWGGFGLYDRHCAPLAAAIFPEIPDNNGNGTNDIYDTCPEWTCDHQSNPDPNFDHVGRYCSGAPNPDGICVGRR